MMLDINKQKAKLAAMVEQRNLAKEMRKLAGWSPLFERDIGILSAFYDVEDIDTAIHYLSRVNAVYQKIRDYPTFCGYCMGATREEAAYLATTDGAKIKNDSLFPQSRAIKVLLFLEYAFFLEPIPYPGSFRELVIFGKKLVAWRALKDFINTDLRVQEVQKGWEIGRICQWDVAMLYAAQQAIDKTTGKKYLDLPFAVTPLDPLVELPDWVLPAALAAARENTESPIKLYEELWRKPFWRIYAQEEGYKKDPTVRGTVLESACQRIEKAVRIATEKGVENSQWGKNFPELTPEESFNTSMVSVFAQGLDATLSPGRAAVVSTS